MKPPKPYIWLSEAFDRFGEDYLREDGNSGDIITGYIWYPSGDIKPFPTRLWIATDGQFDFENSTLAWDGKKYCVLVIVDDSKFEVESRAMVFAASMEAMIQGSADNDIGGEPQDIESRPDNKTLKTEDGDNAPSAPGRPPGPASKSRAGDVHTLFETIQGKRDLTGERGELTKIARKIAKETGYSMDTVRRKITPQYRESPKKRPPI